jgi:glycogen debranching enzyme
MNERVIPQEALARTITVRPESTTILYAGDTFIVRETILVPVDEPGTIIRLDVETEQPLEIEAAFHRDFQLEWPAALGATYSSWNSSLHAFSFGEERKQFAGLVGSPTGVVTREDFESNYASSSESAFRLGITAKGKETKTIVIAGSINGGADAEKTYHKLLEHAADLERDSAKYYEDYLQRTVDLELPDTQLQQAYDWSRITILQGVVANPYLGTGLVAGYRTSGETQRPGFAWFFGRDSLWTSFALNSEGDFATTREALNFLIKFQREDGKIPHEIAQTASLVNWFKDYPFGFASADATPLFIIGVEDYVRSSGDTAFAKEHWNSFWKAYEFLRSTYDESGFPRNLGVGHGWVEGGPLLPVKSELYQSALAVEALHSLSALAKRTGRDADAKNLSEESAKQRARLNDFFWSPEKNTYAFALDQSGKRVDEPSVLATVPMWFGILDSAKSKTMISQLAGLDYATDWGMRIISARSQHYSGGGYHYGSVWPLFTGWAAVGEYRYHRVHPALQNLRANALLALDGSPGHVTEVLSGDYYTGLSTSSPHQIWSAAMVVSPMIRGLLGLKVDAPQQTITLAPSVPADWTSFTARNVRAGNVTVGFAFRRRKEEIELEIQRSGRGDCFVEFQPAFSLRAEILGVELNGRPVPFQLQANETDRHLVTHFAIYGGPNTLRVRMRHDFGVSYASHLPELGHASEGMRILSESWSSSRDQVTFALEGFPGKSYILSLFNGDDLLRADGGTIEKVGDVNNRVVVTFPGAEGTVPVQSKLTLHFAAKPDEGRSAP